MPNRGPHHVVELASWWVLLFLLYLVFISSLSALELAVGAGVSGFAAAVGRAVHRTARPDPGPPGHWLAAAWAWPGTLLAETVRLAELTFASLRGRPSRGRFATVRLRPGVGTAWATVLLSGTPGSCVVAVDQNAGTLPVLTVHKLFASPSRLEAVLTEAPDTDTDTRTEAEAETE
jgi:multisubunit Na+/H+ antiporter MnhE subunit